MTTLIFSCLTLLALLYHILISSAMKKGKIREGYCALWVGDTLFSLLGLGITLSLFHYSLLPYITLQNLFIGASLLLLALILILISPSGLSLFRKKETFSEEEIILSEYRFNDTLGMIRNLLFILLFILPILFALPIRFPKHFAFLSRFQDGELFSGFSLIAFLLLLPISLRQTLFWLKNLTRETSPAEIGILDKVRTENYYRKRNWRL